MELIKLYAALVQTISDQWDAFDLDHDERRIAYHAALVLIFDADVDQTEKESMQEIFLELVRDGILRLENNEEYSFPSSTPVANCFYLLSDSSENPLPPSLGVIEESAKAIDEFRKDFEQEYFDLAYSLLFQEKTEGELLQECEKIDALFKN